MCRTSSMSAGAFPFSQSQSVVSATEGPTPPSESGDMHLRVAPSYQIWQERHTQAWCLGRLDRTCSFPRAIARSTACTKRASICMSCSRGSHWDRCGVHYPAKPPLLNYFLPEISSYRGSSYWYVTGPTRTTGRLHPAKARRPARTRLAWRGRRNANVPGRSTGNRLTDCSGVSTPPSGNSAIRTSIGTRPGFLDGLDRNARDQRVVGGKCAGRARGRRGERHYAVGRRCREQQERSGDNRPGPVSAAAVRRTGQRRAPALPPRRNAL